MGAAAAAEPAVAAAGRKQAAGEACAQVAAACQLAQGEVRQSHSSAAAAGEAPEVLVQPALQSPAFKTHAVSQVPLVCKPNRQQHLLVPRLRNE